MSQAQHADTFPPQLPLVSKQSSFFNSIKVTDSPPQKPHQFQKVVYDKPQNDTHTKSSPPRRRNHSMGSIDNAFNLDATGSPPLFSVDGDASLTPNTLLIDRTTSAREWSKHSRSGSDISSYALSSSHRITALDTVTTVYQNTQKPPARDPNSPPLTATRGGNVPLFLARQTSNIAVNDTSVDVATDDIVITGKIQNGNVGGVYNATDKHGRDWIFKPADEEGYRLAASLEADVVVDGNGKSMNEAKKPFGPEEPPPTSMMPIDSNKMAQFTSDRVALFNGVLYGDISKKELAAYYLDHGHFSGVPRTVALNVRVPMRSEELSRALSLKLEHRTNDPAEETYMDNIAELAATRTVKSDEYALKFGTLQTFIKHFSSAEDMGSSLFSANEVQKIGILDIRLFNLDRHLGNILVSKDERGHFKLTPIDHGYCLPDVRDLSSANFEWMYWKQCKEPFTTKSLNYIKDLNPFADALILRSLGIAQPAILTCVTTTLLLQMASTSGLSLYEIAHMTQRSGLREKPSVLESIVSTALASCDEKFKGYQMDLNNLQLPLPETDVQFEEASSESTPKLSRKNTPQIAATMGGSMKRKLTNERPISASIKGSPHLRSKQAADSPMHNSSSAPNLGQTTKGDDQPPELKLTRTSSPMVAVFTRSRSNSLAGTPTTSPPLTGHRVRADSESFETLPELLLSRKTSPVYNTRGKKAKAAITPPNEKTSQKWTEWLLYYFESVNNLLRVEIAKRAPKSKTVQPDILKAMYDDKKRPAITPMLSPTAAPTSAFGNQDEDIFSLPSLDLGRSASSVQAGGQKGLPSFEL